MEFPATLTCSPLFRDIPQEEMASLLSSMDARRRRFARGETVLRRGEPGDQMGLVLSGTVHIVKEDFWGDRTIVGLARSGEVFGEAYACLGGELLEVTVLADADTEVLFLDPSRPAAPPGTSCSATCLPRLCRRDGRSSTSPWTGSSWRTIWRWTAAPCPPPWGSCGMRACSPSRKTTSACCGRWRTPIDQMRGGCLC